MRHYSLNTIKKFPSFSEFTCYSKDTLDIRKIVLDLGLYDAIAIDTLGNTIEVSENYDEELVYNTAFYSEPPDPRYISKIELSNDVKALNLFLNFNENVMLPCSECRREQAFNAQIATNPRKSPKVIKQELSGTGSPVSNRGTNSHCIPDKKQTTYNVQDTYGISFEYPYLSGKDCPKVQSYSRDFLDSDKDVQDKVIAQYCIEQIIRQIKEIRKDFVCLFDQEHKIFSDFIICRASDCCNEPDELKKFNERKAVNESLVMTEKEQKIFEQYDRLKYCLIFEKVGQEPSMADLQLFDIEKYKKVLSEERYRDFSRALGLYAAGVGCGSLLYLRRIFESVIETVHKECSKESDWNEEEYNHKKFNDKISYLEQFGKQIIPNQISDVKSKIYGLLSKGVHMLSEKEAKELFPYLKFAIEEILDNQIAKRTHEENVKKLKEVAGQK